MEYLQRIARTRRQLIADVEGSEPENSVNLRRNEPGLNWMRIRRPTMV